MFVSFSGPLLNNHDHVANASIVGESGKEIRAMDFIWFQKCSVWGSELKKLVFEGENLLVLLYL